MVGLEGDGRGLVEDVDAPHQLLDHLVEIWEVKLLATGVWDQQGVSGRKNGSVDRG